MVTYTPDDDYDFTEATEAQPDGSDSTIDAADLAHEIVDCSSEQCDSAPALPEASRIQEPEAEAAAEDEQPELAAAGAEAQHGDQTENDGEPAPADDQTENDGDAAPSDEQAEATDDDAEEVEETVPIDEQTGRPVEPIPPAQLKPIVEALLFAAGEPISIGRLREAIDGAMTADIKAALLELQTQYHEEGRGFCLEEIAGGYQLLSSPRFAAYLEKFHSRQSRAKLSAAALETLAIVAYKQPIGRADIEAIRGVQAGPMLRMLMDRGMVKIVGREEVIGRPFLYGTTKKFLERFGLRSLKDLPQAEQLQMP